MITQVAFFIAFCFSVVIALMVRYQMRFNRLCDEIQYKYIYCSAYRKRVYVRSVLNMKEALVEVAPHDYQVIKIDTLVQYSGDVIELDAYRKKN